MNGSIRKKMNAAQYLISCKIAIYMSWMEFWVSHVGCWDLKSKLVVWIIKSSGRKLIWKLFIFCYWYYQTLSTISTALLQNDLRQFMIAICKQVRSIYQFCRPLECHTETAPFNLIALCSATHVCLRWNGCRHFYLSSKKPRKTVNSTCCSGHVCSRVLSSCISSIGHWMS